MTIVINDTQHNNTWNYGSSHNCTQHNDPQLKALIITTLNIMAFAIMTSNTLKLVVTLVSIRTLINDTRNSVNQYNGTQNNDTMHNGTQHIEHNDIHHSDTKHNGLSCDTWQWS